MSRTVVAIDLGASSGRVIAGTLDESGRLEIAECSRFANRAVHVPSAAGDDLQWDLLALWQGIRDGLREATARGPVDAVGIDTWAVDYGLLDADGRLMANPSAYRSTRTREVAPAVLAEVGADWLYARNGLQFQPFNTMFQLVADAGRAQFALARTMLLLPDLLAYWLTGRRCCEVTNASTTGLVDPATRAWSDDILMALAGRFGVDVPALLPPLVEAGEILGPVRIDGADLRTREGGPTPLVAVGSHDTASAVVAVPAIGSGAIGFVSSGTWSLVGVELDAPVLAPASRAANFTNELGVDGTVRYLKNVMGMWVQQEYLRECRERHDTDLAWPALDAQTEAAPQLRSVFDVNDPAFLDPGPMSGRIDAACLAAGEPVPVSRGQYLRAITESLIVAYRRALREAAELSGRPIEAVHVVGGGSKNALLCQLTADATGLPVVAGPVEGTAMGNMVVQLRAIGALGDSATLADLREIIARSVPTRRFQPTPGAEPLWSAAESRALAPLT